MNTSQKEMKRIGIITYFDMRNVNYGNRLQTYALNKKLREMYPLFIIETVQFKLGEDIRIQTKKRSVFERGILKIKHIFKNNESIVNTKLAERLKRCNDFSKNNILLSDELTYQELLEKKYDIVIAGSDVIWQQEKCFYRPIHFLDFDLQRSYKKISYAASFGNDWIPAENEKYVRHSLSQFNAISVREKSSVGFLKSLGINNVHHVLDPTLLLNQNEWQEIEKRPDVFSLNKPYIFTYLLGANKKNRSSIKAIAKSMGLSIVSIPYARGIEDHEEAMFGDARITDCSPEEWLWLIHHADYVVTDSFHGVVFSTIFETPFLAVERKEYGINNRIIDYLNTIKCNDKLVSLSDIVSIDEFEWNYLEIKTVIEEKRKASLYFLSHSVDEFA